MQAKVVEAHSQYTDYGGTDILYPEEFFWLGASIDSKNKTSAWLVHGFHTGIYIPTPNSTYYYYTTPQSVCLATYV